jgi:large subunit ribosomal protein L14
MVYVGTYLRASDNSGAKTCFCIKILGNRKAAAAARLGDTVVVSVQSARSDKKIRKHDVQMGVPVRMRRRTCRFNGTTFRSHDNAIMIIDKKKNPIGTRLFGCVTHELRFRRFFKIVSMASAVV